MPNLPIFQVDAFADGPFTGNPAAVVPMPHWPDAVWMQAVAAENNLSETAFLVGKGGCYALRWFTPGAEVALCGHATLAAAWVVFHHLEPGLGRVVFDTASGDLSVTAKDDLLAMDFPALPAHPVAAPPDFASLLGVPPVHVAASERDWLVEVADPASVLAARPDLGGLAGLVRPGLILTAAGGRGDFTSRFFAPALGVPEDPVTGSAHCTLAPYWAERLGKAELAGHQASRRGGMVGCAVRGSRVVLSGRCHPYLVGEILAQS